MALRDMRAFGHAWDMVVERVDGKQKITVSGADKQVIFTDIGPAGRTYSVSFKGVSKDKAQAPAGSLGTGLQASL
jgi:hypothetical protein